MAVNYVYSAALVGGPPWGFRVACTFDPVDTHYAVAIAQVIAQSRADNERIQTGDVLLTINGRDVGGLKLHEVQRLLKRSAGIIRLTLRRNGSRASSSQRSSQSRLQEIPLNFSNTPSPQPQCNPSSAPYRRTRKRVGPDGGDYNLAYSSEIEDSASDYIYREPFVRPTLQTPADPVFTSPNQEVAPSAPKARLFQTEVKHHILGSPVSSTLRTWAPVQFAPVLMSAPPSPFPDSAPHGTTTTVISQTATSAGNDQDKNLAPESASSRQSATNSAPEDDPLSMAREEGSLTPKPTRAISSSSATPVIIDDEHMQASLATVQSPITEPSGLTESIESVPTSAPEHPSAVGNGHKDDKSLSTLTVDNTEHKINERAVATVAPFEASDQKYLPDDVAFYAESTCSEHPSLATSSLGMDFNDRASSQAVSPQGDADESVMADYDFFSTITNLAEVPSSYEPPIVTDPVQSIPAFNQKYVRQKRASPAHEKGAGELLDSRVKDATPTPLPDTPVPSDGVTSTPQADIVESHTDETTELQTNKPPDCAQVPVTVTEEEAPVDRKNSLDRVSAAAAEPHYPLAFQSQSVISLARTGSITSPSVATTDVTSGPAATYNPYEPYSSCWRGPSFKAAHQPAIWTPNISSSSSLSAKGDGISAYVPAAPIIRTQIMPAYAPADSGDQSSNQQQDSTATMSSGGDAFAAPAPPPPPPPPPPPTSSIGGRYLASVKASKAAQDAADAAIAADPNRSTVEYPEKQSVASLRTTIATKFNGSAPIKGSLPSPGQETAPYKDFGSDTAAQRQFAPSNIDITVQQGPAQNYPSAQYQSIPSATKSVENAAANVVSSVVGVPSTIVFSSSEQPFGKPLSVATAIPVGLGSWRSTPPARPPLPSGLTSPTPPSVPPAPTGFAMQASPALSSSSFASSNFRFGGRPDNFARPYERTSIRGTDNISGIVGERRASDGDHYAIPYRETTTITRRHLGRPGGDYRYDGVGPVDASGLPLGTREMVPGSDQRQWYKMMYKKMHQIDHKDDPSVLRYRLRDSVHDRYVEERSPRRRLGSSTGSSPQRVGYKFAEFMAELPDDNDADTGGMDFEKPWTPKPFNIFERPSRTLERDTYGRTNRPHSANRYDATATAPLYAPSYSQPFSSGLGGEPVNATRQYQFQSSQSATYAPPAAPSAPQYAEEKKRFDLLSNRPQSAVAFGTRTEYQSPYQSRGGVQEYAASSTTYVQKRPLSPLRRDEARQWYQNVQSGGDAPFGGFRQQVPERRDSLFRAAWLYAQLLSKNGNRAWKRDACVQATVGDSSATFLTSVMPVLSGQVKKMAEPTRSLSPSRVSNGKLRQPRDHPGLRDRDHCRTPESSAQTSPARICRHSAPTTPRSKFCSPVRTLDVGTKLYAFERAKTKDFHLPFFRLVSSPTRSPISEKSMDWEIEVYFSYLRKICELERRRVDKCVQVGDDDRSWGRENYDQLLMERRKREEEFQRTYQILRNALEDIEALASPEACQPNIERGKNGLSERGTSYWLLSNGSRSTPSDLDHLRLLSGSSYENSFDRMVQDPHRISFFRENGSFQEQPAAPIRVSSLPNFSQLWKAPASRTWTLKILKPSCDIDRRFGLDSGDTTDLSLNVDSELDDRSGSADRRGRSVVNGSGFSGGLYLRHRRDNQTNGDESSTSGQESGCVSADSELSPRNLSEKRFEPPQAYASLDVSSSYNRTINDRLDFDIDEFSKLERELTQEDERRKRQLKELEDQKAKLQNYSISGTQFSPATSAANFPPAPSQQGQGVHIRGVAKALYNFVAQTSREVSFRKGDLIKIHRQVDDNWYEGECHGKIGVVPAAYVDLAATALGDDRATLTEVSTQAEGLAQVLYRFEGKNVPELPLRKGEYITLTKKIDENWLEGRNEFGRRGIFPANYVKIVDSPSSKTTDIVTASTGSGLPQTFIRGDESTLKQLPNGSQLYDIARHVPSAPAAGISRIRATAPPQRINTLGASNTDLISTARELSQNVRKEFGSRGTGAEALDAALSAGQPDSFQAVFPYKPQNPDELELKENDIVYVVERCDDGWFIGTSLRTGRFGTFPGNYVKRL